MAPVGSCGQPGAFTQKLIKSYFESIPRFQEQFTAAATNVEASGWTVLVWQPAWNRLEILTSEKHQNLTQVLREDQSLADTQDVSRFQR
jgi:Fe-Mn family superoxide dismutase